MLDLIYCEFAKLKRSYFYVLLLSVVCFFPLLLFVGWLGQGKHVTWNYYIIQIWQLSVLFINLPLFTITAAYIYTREYSSNTAQVLFTYTASRTKIFMAKFLIVALISSGAVLLQLILCFASGLFLPHDPLTMVIFLEHIRLNCFIIIYTIALLPVAVLISILSKNIILPVVSSGLVTVMTMSIIGIKKVRGIEIIHQYLPTLYPIDIFFKSFKDNGNDMVIVKSGVYLSGAPVYMAVGMFIVGILLCLLFYNKADIN